jgi:hypothetical protein
MINLELTKEQAVAMLLMLVDEQTGYTEDPVCVPARIVEIRSMIADLDAKLDALVATETES